MTLEKWTKKANCPPHLLFHLSFALIGLFLVGLMNLLPLSGVEGLQSLLKVSEVQVVLLLDLLQDSIKGHTQLFLLLLQTLTRGSRAH